MAEHKPCGFRDKVNVCKFKPEDCNATKCDMYSLEFNAKAIKAEIKRLRCKVKELQKQLIDIAKTQGKASEAYKETLADRNDCVYGIVYLSKSYLWVKRCL